MISDEDKKKILFIKIVFFDKKLKFLFKIKNKYIYIKI